MTPTPLYREFSNTLVAMENCRKANNQQWLEHREDKIKKLVDFLPHGSGIDNGITLDADSNPEKLVFHFGFHHMNDNGFYDGWTDHKLIVKPSLRFGIDIRITGKDRNSIKDYLHDLFSHALTSSVWQSSDGKWHSSQFERFSS